MAITPDDIDALPDYSAANQLKIWQKASIELAAYGISRSIAGRVLTVSNWKEVKDALNYWTGQVLAESGDDSADGDVLIRFEDNS